MEGGDFSKMRRFPRNYARPETVDLGRGPDLGWTARCDTGNNASSGCISGNRVFSSPFEHNYDPAWREQRGSGPGPFGG